MDSERLIDSLARFGRVLPAVVAEVSDEDARWKPADGAWSILEVVCHLADEEEADFRERLRRTLQDPADAWPPIDPEGWARERAYNEKVLADEVARFATAREQSIQWLRGLAEPDWSRTHDHPRFGPFHAGDLLAAWAAHDQLHLRQIAKRLYQLTEHHAGQYSVRYAGPWT